MKYKTYYPVKINPLDPTGSHAVKSRQDGCLPLIILVIAIAIFALIMVYFSVDGKGLFVGMGMAFLPKGISESLRIAITGRVRTAEEMLYDSVEEVIDSTWNKGKTSKEYASQLEDKSRAKKNPYAKFTAEWYAWESGNRG